MGNRESSSACASETDYLESSTESTSISGYRVLMQNREYNQKPQSQHHDWEVPVSKPSSPLPSLRVTPPPLPPQRHQQHRQHSEVLPSSHSPPLTGDLCSVLNHHHDSFFEPSSARGSSCVCRRSLSTSGCGDRPRILPIMRNGRQLSDDLFWVLPQRKKHIQQEQLLQEQNRLSSCTSSSNQSCCEPLSFCGPGCSPLDLVRRVTEAVFGVTDEESYLSLSLHHWDTDRAIRYLKVEQLFRQGVWDRERCVKLLEMHDWRLDSVMQQLNRKRMCRSDSH